VVNARWVVSTSWASAVTLIRAPGAGTRLTQTRTLIRAPKKNGQARREAPATSRMRREEEAQRTTSPRWSWLDVRARKGGLATREAPATSRMRREEAAQRTTSPPSLWLGLHAGVVGVEERLRADAGDA